MRGPILAGAAALAVPSCFYVPPITSLPVELDTPPFVLGFEPDIIVDLRTDPIVALTVDAVYDFNDVEEIDWAVALFPTPSSTTQIEVASDELMPREVQSFPDATEYEGPGTTLNACDASLVAARGDRDLITVDLVLTDAIPAAQQQQGFDEFRVVYTWRLRFTGECPE